MRACLVFLICFLAGTLTAFAGSASPPDTGYASDQWLTGEGAWLAERQRRDAQIEAFLKDNNAEGAEAYGFRRGHTPALAWNWFDRHPVGFNGVPNVLLQTLLSLDPASESDPHLLPLANIWRKASKLPGEANSFTLDHIGAGPHPADYENGVAKAPADRRFTLPNGMVFDPTVEPKRVFRVTTRLKALRRLRTVRLLTLFKSRLRQKILYDDQINYDTEVHKLQEAPSVDAVFFACSACHVGRVIVGGEIDGDGNQVRQGKVHFLPGMPNTEIEAQHYSEVLLETGLALIESGFSIDHEGLPNPDNIEPRKEVIKALFTRMIERALDRDIVRTIYGPLTKDVQRAKVQTYWVAKDFTTYISKLIGTAVKTQYIYHQVGKKFAYNPDNPNKQPGQSVPDLMNDRPGQMDAFGIASGLTAIHTKRPDNSYMTFMQKDYPQNPLFTGIATTPGFEDPAGPVEAGKRIFEKVATWAPPVPAPIDIKSLNWATQRQFANWDGNQGAAARALASGTSATGTPLDTNVRIHEPLNPFINFLPPPAYPFDIDKEKARRGQEVFTEAKCANCHKPNNDKIYSAAKLGLDANRSKVNTDVSRFGLAGLVMEACRIFMRKNEGNDWCLPRDADNQVITDTATAYDEYFKDTPGRVRDEKNGYKADMLHGIWARAPYLHNGSVPTLLQLMCPQTRPAKFVRGNIYYDQKMVGFEWNIVPKQRYSPHDVIQVKAFDTAEFGRSNGGHAFTAGLCPDTSDLDPVADRAQITERVLGSPVGDLLEYLKTF